MIRQINPLETDQVRTKQRGEDNNRMKQWKKEMCLIKQLPRNLQPGFCKVPRKNQYLRRTTSGRKIQT